MTKTKKPPPSKVDDSSLSTRDAEKIAKRQQAIPQLQAVAQKSDGLLTRHAVALASANDECPTVSQLETLFGSLGDAFHAAAYPPERSVLSRKNSQLI